jgi:hypothetical protein
MGESSRIVLVIKKKMDIKIDSLEVLTEMLTYDHNEFLTYLVDAEILVGEIAEKVENYFYDNEPLMMILLGDIEWLDVAEWVQALKLESQHLNV